MVCALNIEIVCACVSAMQTQLAQQRDTIKELEEKIEATTLEMIKVYPCMCSTLHAVLFI